MSKGDRWPCITLLSYKKRTRGSEPKTLDKSDDVNTVEHSSKLKVLWQLERECLPESVRRPQRPQKTKRP